MSELDKKIDFLQECSDLEGAELGEGIQQLLDIYEYRYIFSDKFSKAIKDEINFMYEYIDSNFEIVEREEEIITKVKTRDLVEK